MQAASPLVVGQCAPLYSSSSHHQLPFSEKSEGEREEKNQQTTMYYTELLHGPISIATAMSYSLVLRLAAPGDLYFLPVSCLEYSDRWRLDSLTFTALFTSFFVVREIC